MSGRGELFDHDAADRPALPVVRLAEAEDVPELASMLSRAFTDDPVASYIFPGRDRADQLRRFFELQIDHNYLHRGEVYLVDDGRAAAMWMPPSPRGVRPLDLLAHARLLGLLSTRFFATRRLSLMLAARHPRGDHYYLGTIGTDPLFQGQGLGSALLTPVLARCDTRRLGAYLECSKLENVAFYARHGFAVTDEVRPPGGGPTLWLMWRNPVAP